MDKLKKLFRWVLVSSADAERYSLTLRAALIGAIPAILWATGAACGLELVCVEVSGDLLREISSGASNALFLALSAVSAAGTVYGLVRKIKLTATGKNAALAS